MPLQICNCNHLLGFFSCLYILYIHTHTLILYRFPLVTRQPYHLSSKVSALFFSLPQKGVPPPAMVMEDNWDLNAVVRGCTTLAPASSSTSTVPTGTTTAPSSYSAPSNSYGTNYQLLATPGSSFPTAFDFGQENHLFSLSDPFESRIGSEELHEMCRPFFPKSQGFMTPKAETLNCFSYTSTAPKVPQPQLQPKHKQLLHTHSGSTPISKRRKNQHKKVCQVPAEALSEDIWSWRKYGQKPIKGSPYPRGYYRCSSSKGCLARKQVERNKSDPRIFTVTYTAEHNHPAPTHKNSLAGSTRQKPATPKAAGDCDSDQKLLTEPTSPVTPKKEEKGVPQSTTSEGREEDKVDFADDEEEEDELDVGDMELADDFFTGFDEFTSPASSPDHFPATIAISSWTTS